jgi:hypothetical protein
MSVDSHEFRSKVAERLGDMGDLADPGLDEHVRAQHRADVLASDHAIALTWQMAPRAVDDAQDAQAVDDVAPEH